MRLAQGFAPLYSRETCATQFPNDHLDTIQSPGALTGRRVPLYERSGEGERAPASGLVALAQSGGEDAGPARPDGDES